MKNTSNKAVGTGTKQVLNVADSGAPANVDSGKTTNEEHNRAKRWFLKICVEAGISPKEFWLLDEMLDMPTKYSRNRGYAPWAFTAEQLSEMLEDKRRIEAHDKRYEQVSLAAIQQVMDKLFDGRKLDADRVISHIHIHRAGLDEVDKAGRQVRLPVYTFWSNPEERKNGCAKYKAMTFSEKEVQEAEKEIKAELHARSCDVAAYARKEMRRKRSKIRENSRVVLDKEFEGLNERARVFLCRDEYWNNYSRRLQKEHGITAEECRVLECLTSLDWRCGHTMNDLAAYVNQSTANKLHPSKWPEAKFITGEEVRAILQKLWNKKGSGGSVEFGDCWISCDESARTDEHGESATLDGCSISPNFNNWLLLELHAYEAEIIRGSLVKTASGDWVMLDTGEVAFKGEAKPSEPLKAAA